MATPLDIGLTVVGATGLDSAVLNRLFLTPVGKAVGKAGLKLAASGGKLRKGIFVWKEPDGNIRKFVFPMNPESIRETVAPVYVDTLVPGQNRPLYQFINGGPREVSFKLNFFYAQRAREHVRDEIRTLQNLTQRRYASVEQTGVYQGPPVISFYFGEYFEGTQFIITKADLTAFDLFDPVRLLPMRADMDLSMVEVMPTTQGVGERVGAGEQIVRSVLSNSPF